MEAVYHTSPEKDLKLIEPKPTISKDKYLGDYVFATSNKLLAVMYLATRGYATLMNPDKDNPNIVICADKNDYLKNDRGGAIYKLPGETFIETPQHGLSDYEKVSTHSVKPIEKTIYRTSIEAMLDAKIKIYFTDSVTFNSLIGAKDQAKRISKLTPFTTQ
jgi:hypothetical protein